MKKKRIAVMERSRPNCLGGGFSQLLKVCWYTQTIHPLAAASADEWVSE